MFLKLHTNRQTNTQTDRQTDKQTNRQTDAIKFYGLHTVVGRIKFYGLHTVVGRIILLLILIQIIVIDCCPSTRVPRHPGMSC